MLRRAALIIALTLALPANAQSVADGFRFAGVSLENGGHPSGDYTQLTATTNAVYGLGWGELAVDLSLSTAHADFNNLNTAEALLHLTARPTTGIALGPYLWLGSQSEGGATFALGVEAAVSTASGWGGALYFGETRGGPLGDGYSTNKGLRLSYQGKSRYSGHIGLFKDTINLDAGDQDFYRLALGLDTWLDIPSPSNPDRSALLSLAIGQHHFDKLDDRENWFSVGISFPLQGAPVARPVFSSQRGVLHRLPMP